MHVPVGLSDIDGRLEMDGIKLGEGETLGVTGSQKWAGFEYAPLAHTVTLIQSNYSSRRMERI